MPRLGDDPNVATAYPNRLQTNLRGSWLRQLLTTVAGSLLILFIMNKLFMTDYKEETKKALKAKGMEDKTDEIIRKTPREKRQEAQRAKQTEEQKVLALQYEVGNLTNSVIELQQLFVNRLGVSLQHPMYNVTNSTSAITFSTVVDKRDSDGAVTPPSPEATAAEAGAASKAGETVADVHDHAPNNTADAGDYRRRLRADGEETVRSPQGFSTDETGQRQRGERGNGMPKGDERGEGREVDFVY